MPINVTLLSYKSLIEFIVQFQTWIVFCLWKSKYFAKILSDELSTSNGEFPVHGMDLEKKKKKRNKSINKLIFALYSHFYSRFFFFRVRPRRVIKFLPQLETFFHIRINFWGYVYFSTAIIMTWLVVASEYRFFFLSLFPK